MEKVLEKKQFSSKLPYFLNLSYIKFHYLLTKLITQQHKLERYMSYWPNMKSKFLEYLSGSTLQLKVMKTAWGFKPDWVYSIQLYGTYHILNLDRHEKFFSHVDIADSTNYTRWTVCTS